MAFHAKFINRRGVVHANFLLLGVVADAHPDMLVAVQAPHVERHFEADGEDSLAQFPCSFTEWVGVVVAVHAAMLGWVEIGWDPLVGGFPLCHGWGQSKQEIERDLQDFTI
jgi:hypothetical protein